MQLQRIKAPDLNRTHSRDIFQYNNDLVDTLLRTGKVTFEIECMREKDVIPDNLLLTEKDAREAGSYLPAYLIGPVHKNVSRYLGKKDDIRLLVRRYSIMFHFHRKAGTVYGKITPIENVI